MEKVIKISGINSIIFYWQLGSDLIEQQKNMSGVITS